MAGDKNPSALTAAGTPDGTEAWHVVQAGNSRKLTLSQALAKQHNHAISDVTGLQTALDAKLDDSQANAGGLAVLGAADAAAVRAAAGLGSVATLDVDTDATMAADSDTRVPSQKAVVTLIAVQIAAAVTGLWDPKGGIDCSGNPNYPAASKGDTYVVTVAGKIGGASGTSVGVGDVIVCFTDNAGGTQAAVGASWDTVLHSAALTGALLAANSLSDVASKVAAKDNISVKGADIASASTTDLSTATGDFVFVTGTATITALGTCAAGVERTVKFAGALTLTHNATSLILPSAANITTAANDIAVFRSLGSGNWLCVGYTKANGQALSGSGGSSNIVDANWFNVKDVAYGAKGDGVHLTDGATTNGSTTFTSASAAFVSGDVGKVIEIISGANRKQTTISAVGSGTSITLASAPTFTATGCDVYYGTDDTTAIQNAINACETAGGGTVYLPRGIYVVNGALQDTSRSNAQIVLPKRDYITAKAITVVFRGEAAPSTGFSVIGATPVPDRLSIIKGTLNTASGTAPCLIGAHGPVGTTYNFTNFYFVMRDLTVRMPADPALTAVDLSCVSQVDLDNVVIDTGIYDVTAVAAQSTSTSYGLRTPAINNGALTRLGIVTVVGFYNGVEISEHCVGQDVTAGACKQAFVYVAAYHASSFTRLQAVHCQKGLVGTGGFHFTAIQEFNIEHAASGTWVPTYDVDDASNYLGGTANWNTVLAGSGGSQVLLVNGAKYLERIQLRAKAAVYGLTDGATVTIDCSLACNFRWTIGGSRTFANPTNPYAGQVINVRIIQDGTGGRVWTLGSKFKFPGGAATLSTAASAKDFVSCQYDESDDTWNCSIIKALA